MEADLRNGRLGGGHCQQELQQLQEQQQRRWQQVELGSTHLDPEFPFQLQQKHLQQQDRQQQQQHQQQRDSSGGRFAHLSGMAGGGVADGLAHQGIASAVGGRWSPTSPGGRELRVAMTFQQQQQFFQEQRGGYMRNSPNNSNDNYSVPAAAVHSGVGREMAETGRTAEDLRFETLRKAEALKAVSGRCWKGE